MRVPLKAYEDFLQSNTRRKKLIPSKLIVNSDLYLEPAERGVIFLHYTKTPLYILLKEYFA